LLHQPLGQLARKALNLPPKIDTKRYGVRSNQIAALISHLGNLIEAICKDRFHWSSSASGIDDVTNEMIVFVERDNEG